MKTSGACPATAFSGTVRSAANRTDSATSSRKLCFCHEARSIKLRLKAKENDNEALKNNGNGHGHGLAADRPFCPDCRRRPGQHEKQGQLLENCPGLHRRHHPLRNGVCLWPRFGRSFSGTAGPDRPISRSKPLAGTRRTLHLPLCQSGCAGSLYPGIKRHRRCHETDRKKPAWRRKALPGGIFPEQSTPS